MQGNAMQVLYDVTCKVFNNTLLTNFHIICLPKNQLTVAPNFLKQTLRILCGFTNYLLLLAMRLNKPRNYFQSTQIKAS